MVSDSQKLDVLWKKIGFGVSKTDSVSAKSGTNETHSSPLQIYGHQIWTQANLIPGVPPFTSTSYVGAKTGVNAITCTHDNTSTEGRTWLTGIQDWIPDTFASSPGSYNVKVWLGSVGGTRLFADGSGNQDEYFFDPSSGILHFIGTNLPAGVTKNSTIIVEGYTYVGAKGITPQNVTTGAITHFFPTTTARNADSTVKTGDIAVISVDSTKSAYMIYIAVADGPTSNWAMVSTPSDTTVNAKTYTTIVDYGTHLPVVLGTITDTHKVNNVIVEVLDIFTDPTAVMTVGDNTDVTSLMPTSEIDLHTAGGYMAFPTNVYTQSADLMVFLSAGNSTAGRARVTITTI